MPCLLAINSSYRPFRIVLLLLPLSDFTCGPFVVFPSNVRSIIPAMPSRGAVSPGISLSTVGVSMGRILLTSE